MFEPSHPDHVYRLRDHRLNSVSLHLTTPELVELRAAQRTFEGAYARTALSLFSFSLIILKIFTREFYPIGVLFSVYGALVMGIAAYRRAEGNRMFFDQHEVGAGGVMGARLKKGVKVFRTSGNVVVTVGVVTVTAYVGLIVLVFRLKQI